MTGYTCVTIESHCYIFSFVVVGEWIATLASFEMILDIKIKTDYRSYYVQRYCGLSLWLVQAKWRLGNLWSYNR